MVETRRLGPGDALGSFTITRAIGSGSFSDVYEARDDGGRVVALKVAKHSWEQNQATRSLLDQQNEIEALMKLDHPAIVKVQEFGFIEGGGLFVATELVLGQSLDDYVTAKARLDTIEALPIMQRVAGAVAHCHALGILHRDLKPANIILEDPYEPRVKVLDFGFAHLASAWTPKGTSLAGTVVYMPPEAFVRATAYEPTVRSDLYALGTILYQLLSGRLPFAYEDAADLVSEKVSGAPVPLREVVPMVPEPVAQLVEALIARDPAARPRSASAVADELQALYFTALGSGAMLTPSPRPSSRSPQVPEASVQGPCVGRDPELSHLTALASSVARGAGRAAVIEGNAGIGKSRVVSELLSRLPGDRTTVVYGRCREPGVRIPFAALREALGHVAEILSRKELNGGDLSAAVAEAAGEEAALISKLVPELGGIVAAGVAANDTVLQLMNASHIAGAVQRIFAALGTWRPVTFIIEDLHWADPGTFEVLRHFLAAVPERVLFLATRRPGEQALPPGVEVLALDELSGGANDEQLASLLGGPDAAELVARLKRELPPLRAGNPLYNIQVIHHLTMAGHLQVDPDGGLVLGSDLPADYQPPDSVGAALERVLEGFDAGPLRLLGVAALLGRQFRIGDLEALELGRAEQVEGALAIAESYHLIHRRGSHCFFVHDSIREGLEASIPEADVEGLHARIADHFAASAFGDEPARLAYHLERAGRPRKAGEAYYRAGVQAEALRDVAGAVDLWTRGSEQLIASPASPERDALLVRTAQDLARSSCLTGQTREVLARLERVSELLPELTPEQSVGLRCAYARVHYATGDFPRAVARSQEVLGQVAKMPELAAYACVPSNILGRALSASGKFGPARDMLLRGVELAEKAGEQAEVSHSEGVLSVALGYVGEYEQARARAESCWSIAERLGDSVRMAGAHFYYAVLGESKFDWNMGVEYSARLLSFVEERRMSGLYLLMGTIFGGRHQFHVGRLGRARALLHNALNLSNVLGIGMGKGWAQAFLGDVYFVAGDHTAARRCYEDGLAIGNAGGKDEYAAGTSLIGLAHTEAHLGGDLETTRRWAGEGLTRLEQMSNITAMAHALQRYAEALEHLGDEEGAAAVQARRAQNNARISVEVRDWWPQVPEELVVGETDRSRASTKATSSGRGLWEQLRQSTGAELPTVRMTSSVVPSTRDNLMESLANVDDYVPGFVAPRA